VASVFVSRIDTMIDKMLDEKKDSGLAALKGKAAVANCQLVYEKSKELFTSPRFDKLAKKNAGVQRVLWGSTSTKNPDYRDVKYVEELIANDTVNTIPESTLMAFLDHGQVASALKGSKKEASDVLAQLKKADINIDVICQKLLEDGVVAFEKAFADLMKAIETKANQLCAR
jgi:transaldolase